MAIVITMIVEIEKLKYDADQLSIPDLPAFFGLQLQHL